MELLDRALDQARRYQAPQLVTVVGGQGLGKSRLVAEWLERLGELPAPGVRIYRGRAAEGDGSYSLVSRLLRDRFAVGEAESAEAIAGKVRAVLEGVFADRRVAEVVHFLGRYLPVAQRETPFLRAMEDQ